MAVMMPDKSGPARGEPRLSLSLMKFYLRTNSPISLRRRKIRRTPLTLANSLQLASVVPTAVPANFSTPFELVCKLSVWRTARPDNDFGAILPHLETLLALVREMATARSGLVCRHTKPSSICTNPAVGPLIWMRCSTIMSFLRFWTASLKSNRYGLSRVCGPFPQVRQETMPTDGRAVGFDFATGRLDATLHPFSGGIPRIVVLRRYDEADFTSALMGVLQTGHICAAWSSAVGAINTSVTHRALVCTSQSLMVEMQASRSRAFLVGRHR